MLDKFTTYTQPRLKKWKRYYIGEHDILQKKYKDASKACSNIVTNYCKVITDTYSGYICGKPVSYSSNDDIEEIQEVINYNDDDAENIAFITNALNYGVAYELQWIDEQAKVRYSQVNPVNAFAVYSNNLDANLLYFVRWYDEDNLGEDDTQFVEVYSATDVKIYKRSSIGGVLSLIEEKQHYFNDVPVSVFWLNENEENIFNSVISLNDAYNEIQSSEVDDFSAFCDAYLVLTGASIDAEDVTRMKKDRVLDMPEGSTAEWLVKNANNTQVVHLLDNIKKNIFKISNCPDMSDEAFLAQSGTALAYKLVGFENVSSAIVARFTKAIQRRIELICNVVNLKSESANEHIWRDINISFVRNLPVNITETIQLVNSLKGIVSDATLLSQIPFVDDVNAEIEALQKQKEANMALYSFGGVNNDIDEETE
jgi:SPP1 family phage portal protein